MLWAAFTIALYGFLRVGEPTSLRWSDIAFSPDHISISLHQSKTHPFRHGYTIKTFSTSSSTCPYHALDCYRRLSDSSTPSTYMFQSGRFHPLSWAAVTNTLRQLLKQVGFNYSQYASHSFRIRAATTTAAAGLPAWLIKNLGRWSSSTYFSYIHQESSLTSKVISHGCFQPTHMGTRYSSNLKYTLLTHSSSHAIIVTCKTHVPVVQSLVLISLCMVECKQALVAAGGVQLWGNLGITLVN